MSKGQKSMDEVLASIRKIIRTDPTAAPPDIRTSSSGGVVGDETAREVLEKLRREREGEEEREAGKPLSESDDPDEAARAVLDHLRRQAEAEAKQELERPPEPAEEPEPALEPTPEEPPAVAADEDAVPVVDEPAPGPEEETTAAPEGEPLELGAEEGRRVLEPQSPPAPDPELPQPAAAPARGGREAPVMVDEAALEAMIRRVVRDELMGDMGRRITRNVVKLIREEIAKSRIEQKDP